MLQEAADHHECVCETWTRALRASGGILVEVTLKLSSKE